jgi:hypothetical protein
LLSLKALPPLQIVRKGIEWVKEGSFNGLAMLENAMKYMYKVVSDCTFEEGA